MATSLLRNTRNYRSICFLITKFQKLLKVKSDSISETAPKNTYKYQISGKSVKGFRSYECLKRRPTRRLKFFVAIAVEYIKTLLGMLARLPWRGRDLDMLGSMEKCMLNV